MTFKQAQSILRERGIVIRKTQWDDYRVCPKDGSEAIAYYTTDLVDAVDSGKDMSIREWQREL